jgi:hypothetical protein
MKVPSTPPIKRRRNECFGSLTRHKDLDLNEGTTNDAGLKSPLMARSKHGITKSGDALKCMIGGRHGGWSLDGAGMSDRNLPLLFASKVRVFSI